MDFTSDIAQGLLKPFPADQVEWKPQGNHKVAFIDARDVMFRLDEVVPGQWSFDWEPITVNLENVVVKGRLTVLGVTRCDAGESHINRRAKEPEDLVKAAVSDALKRCAVQFGVGRFLYELGVSHDGRLTQAQLDAAAAVTGYVQPDDPVIHEVTCGNCGVDVEYSFAQATWRKASRYLCPECAEKLEVFARYFCAECEVSTPPKKTVVEDRIAQISLQRFGRILCQPCGKAIVKLEKAGVAIG